MAARFYINWPLCPGPVTLEGPEAHHLTSVCRLRPGDAVCLFNGDGLEYAATIRGTQRRSVTLEIDYVAAPERELPFQLEIAAPLPKGDRAQFLVEKLTELGATVFVPLLTTRTVIEPREAKLEKLQRYVIEASKQCGRNLLMRVDPVTLWSDYAARQGPDETRWLAHPGSGVIQGLALRKASRIRCVVGPEGGWSPEEVAVGATSGWQLVNLGPRVLRIETAALALAVQAIGLHS